MSKPADDPGNPTVNFHGQKRSNKTHQSATDPEAMLCRKGKGKEAKLGNAGHLLMENRNGLEIRVANYYSGAGARLGRKCAQHLRRKGLRN